MRLRAADVISPRRLRRDAMEGEGTGERGERERDGGEGGRGESDGGLEMEVKD